jgi:hypothetical protein
LKTELDGWGGSRGRWRSRSSRATSDRATQTAASWSWSRRTQMSALGRNKARRWSQHLLCSADARRWPPAYRADLFHCWPRVKWDYTSSIYYSRTAQHSTAQHSTAQHSTAACLTNGGNRGPISASIAQSASLVPALTQPPQHIINVPARLPRSLPRMSVSAGYRPLLGATATPRPPIAGGPAARGRPSQGGRFCCRSCRVASPGRPKSRACSRLRSRPNPAGIAVSPSSCS